MLGCKTVSYWKYLTSFGLLEVLYVCVTVRDGMPVNLGSGVLGSPAIIGQFSVCSQVIFFERHLVFTLALERSPQVSNGSRL